RRVIAGEGARGVPLLLRGKGLAARGPTERALQEGLLGQFVVSLIVETRFVDGCPVSFPERIASHFVLVSCRAVRAHEIVGPHSPPPQPSRRGPIVDPVPVGQREIAWLVRDR